jgi:UDP-N-acetyl-D-glucosamine dehydrogenase
MKNEILRKIKNREIVVGVVGLGYVGLPLAVEKAIAGFKTIGIDIRKEKVDMVNRGENYIGDVVDANLAKIVKAGMLSATTDFSVIQNIDFVAICVPTPLDKYQQPDLSYVIESTKEIARNLKKGAMIVLESTTYPGTTEEVLKPLLENGSSMKCGKDFYLGFSPERVDPGNATYNTKNTPKVVGAIGKDATECISQMYKEVLDGEIFQASSPAIAEMEKLLENTYRNINIGLINELAILSHKMGIDIWEVIEAAKTKPFGFQAFYPGPGLGGHCIPLDPYYLAWKAREYGFHTSMIESSMMINDRMPEYTTERISKTLNRFKKPLNGAKVLQLGVAYKQDIGDYRESPAVAVMQILEKSGAIIKYFDPYVPAFKYDGKQYNGEKMLTEQLIKEQDIVVITTGHTIGVDYAIVVKHAKIIFDSKNVLKNIKTRKNIEVL